jgi:hypothetical protein
MSMLVFFLFDSCCFLFGVNDFFGVTDFVLWDFVGVAPDQVFVLIEDLDADEVALTTLLFGEEDIDVVIVGNNGEFGVPRELAFAYEKPIQLAVTRHDEAIRNER